MTNFKISFSHPWLLLLLIPAIALTLLPYFLSKKKYRRNRNRIISVALHGIVMTLCVFLISGITFGYRIPNRGNELILLVDRSHSGSEQQNAKDEFIQSVIDECGSDFRVGVVKFGYNQVYAAQLSSDRGGVMERYLDSAEPDTSATDVASALRYARTLFTNPQAGKIVLLSDGIETDGNALSVIKSVAAEGIKVDTVYFPNEAHGEVQIVGVKTPDYNINVGDKFNLELTLQSNLKGDVQASVTVLDNGNAGEAKEYKISEGVQTVKAEHAFDVPGLHELCIRIECEGDTLAQNNTYYSYVNVEIFENILIIEKDEGEGGTLKAMLESEYEVTDYSVEQDIAQMPKNLTELCEFKQVILVNIANSDLEEIGRGLELGQSYDALLYEYVHDVGGGLFTVGGNNDENNVPHAYNREDMLSGSGLYQEMLPVQVVNYTPPVAVMLVIDSSGSMGSGEDSPMYFAKQGALAVFDVLNPRDFCGIMTLDDDPTEILKVTEVSNKREIEDAINRITSEGMNGTVYTTAIQRAGAALAGVSVQQKHIILVTDGQPGDADEFGEAIDINTKNGITMSIVSIGSEGDLELMQSSAAKGQGKFYNPIRVEDIAVAIKNDLTTEAVAEIMYGEPFSLFIDNLTPAVAGIRQEDLPAIYGYYGTREKEGAEVPLRGGFAPSGDAEVTVSAQRVPIYAQWKYGEGSVGSFLCDFNGNWSKDFVVSAAGQRFLNNVVTGLFPTKDIRQSDIKVVLREDNYTNQLNVYTPLGEGESIEVSVAPTAHSEEALDFYRDSPVEAVAAEGYSRFTFAVTVPGLYRITIVKKSAAGNSELVLYKSLSYSAEYDAFPEKQPIGAQYLAELASGGKGVAVEDVFDVFDSFEREQNRTYDPRLPFLIVAIVLFLLDVAVRKFKFKWLHEIVRDRKAKRAEQEKRKTN